MHYTGPAATCRNLPAAALLRTSGLTGHSCSRQNIPYRHLGNLAGSITLHTG